LPLPQICPLNNTNGCKGKDCHLHHVDWRTGEENCSIGYRYTHRTTGFPHVVEDNYARDVKLRKTQTLMRETEVVEKTPGVIREENRNDSPAGICNSSGNNKEVYVKPAVEIVTPIASPEDDDTNDKFRIASSGKKKSKIDEIINMDLPEDYEEEFWSDEGKRT
jgi:hypothetical protein